MDVIEDLMLKSKRGQLRKRNRVRTRVTFVGVGLERAGSFCHVQCRLWDDLVQGESTASEDLAGVAMAVEKLVELFSTLLEDIELKSIPKDVLLLLLLELNGPLSLTAVALSIEGCHDYGGDDNVLFSSC